MTEISPMRTVLQAILALGLTLITPIVSLQGQASDGASRPEAAAGGDSARPNPPGSPSGGSASSNPLPPVLLTPKLLKPSAAEPLRPAESLRPAEPLRPAIRPAPESNSFEWRPAVEQSLRFLALQHSFRLWTEAGTRSEIRGPFFRDYVTSVTGLTRWGDGDEFYVNYVGHPMMGSVSGLIQRQNDPRYRAVVFGASPHYWRSTMRSLVFNAVYSTQFEIGPLSEASIGNVGKIPGTQGLVDLVITPTMGTAWMVGEDAIDRYLIRKIEGVTTNRWLKLVARAGLNPTRAMANLMRGRTPWYRDDRGGLFIRGPAPTAGTP